MQFFLTLGLPPQCFSDNTKWQPPWNTWWRRKWVLKRPYEGQGSRARLIAWNLSLEWGSLTWERGWKKISSDCFQRLWQTWLMYQHVLANSTWQVTQQLSSESRRVPNITMVIKLAMLLGSGSALGTLVGQETPTAKLMGEREGEMERGREREYVTNTK